MINFEELEAYDRNKTKVLKYVLYKKRSVNEIIRKFEKDIDSNMLEDIIADLKENGYIDDSQYVQRAVNEFMALKNISLKQIKYKLLSKGIDQSLIEDYFYQNREDEFCREEISKFDLRKIVELIKKLNISENLNKKVLSLLTIYSKEYSNKNQNKGININKFNIRITKR